MLALAIAGFASGCGIFFEKHLQTPLPARSSTSQIVEDFARALEAQTSLARSSGNATAVRLKALFPSMDVDKLVLGVGATDRERSEAQFFVSKDRPSTAVSQIMLQNVAADRCAKPAEADNAIFTPDGWLRRGEALPVDPAAQAALLAARKIWLYPYPPSAPEVLELASLYRDAAAQGSDPATGDLEGKKAVCVAALSAPQFWMGNPGKLDVVRRLALELAYRVPRMDEFEAVESGALSLEEFVKSLQKEAGYLAAVKQWHKTWLGFEDHAPVNGTYGSTPRPTYGTASTTANMLASIPFHYKPLTITGLDGKPKDVKTISVVSSTHTYPLEEYISYGRNEECAPKEQVFSHETSRIQWEQKNPAQGGRWEVLVSHVKDATTGAWSESNTSADPAVPVASLASGLTIRLQDITIPRAVAPVYSFHFRYDPGSRLSGSQFDNDEKGFPSGSIRVRRFDANGVEQNGYSKVKLWYSDEEVYVCNTTSRFVATCLYRPTGDYKRPYFESATTKWSAATPGVLWDLYSIHRMSLGNGQALENYSCGVPNEGALKQDPASELEAFPKKSAQAPFYNDVAVNVRPDGYQNEITDGIEYKAWEQIARDMNNEPYALIEEIVTKGLDYRLLLTADFTIGHPALKSFYQTQGYYLPLRPQGFAPPAGGAGLLAAPAERIRSADFAPFPRTWLRNANGDYPHNSYADSGFGGIFLREVTPRPFSGILTQASFIHPMSPKVRSLASRVFERLLCSDPSAIKLDSDAQALHVKYMFTGSNKHLFDPALPEDDDLNRGKKACFACHVNLDPLGKALSLAFAKGKDIEEAYAGYAYAAIGEMHPFFNYNGPKRPAFLGLQGTSDPQSLSEGALLGHVVTGVKEVGRVLADSNEFAGCVTLKAFESLFGRKPTFRDAELLTEASSSFMGHHDYNQLIRELALSASFAREY